MKRTPFLILVGAVLICSFLMLVSSQQKYAGATSYSGNGSGLRLFLQLADHFRPGDVDQRHTALLNPRQLDGVGLYIIASPKRELTEREAALLATFAKDGGTVVGTFHSGETYSALVPALGGALNIGSKELGIEEVPGFENGRTTDITVPASSSWLPANQFLTIYSPFRFRSPECSGTSFSCYVKEIPVGKGRVVLLSTIPPFANALLLRGGNPELTSLVLSVPGKLVIDEYHHFFTDKSLKDVFLRPSFSLPLLGIVGLALLYFAFGYSHFAETSSRTQAVVPATYHAIQGEVLAGLLSRFDGIDGAVSFHRQYVERRFPEAVALIEDLDGRSKTFGEPFEYVRELSRLHSRLLER